ncbi:SAF domain-containing protein [Pseudidiomarina sp.]|uniref:SAF domain-containing protein n=1 Tax=Pseudidiomarina sp. TaxID=2081707 RepID=UPI003A9883F2
MRVSQGAKISSFILLSLLMTIAGYQLIQSYVEEKTNIEIQQQQEHMFAVLVSRDDLLAGEIIDAGSLVKRSYPMSLVQDSWLRPEDAPMIIGLSTTRYIEKGEPLTADVLLPFEDHGFSKNIKAGHYAVTSMISKQQLHNGLVRVGDKVTLVSRSLVSEAQHAVLVNIKIVALDNFDHNSQLDMSATHYLPSTITFELTPSQAIVFETMKQQSFAVWLQHPDPPYADIKVNEPIAIHRLKSAEASQHAIY